MRYFLEFSAFKWFLKQSSIAAIDWIIPYEIISENKGPSVGSETEDGIRAIADLYISMTWK